jgi:hypothetical protein
VAEAIHNAVTEPTEYPGGTVLEILASGSRVLPEWYISPPEVKVPAEAIAKGLKPILEITAGEKRHNGL